jgi:hypothetical protein
MRYQCTDSERRARLLEQLTGTNGVPPVLPADVINAIDFLEVDDDPADPLDLRQRTLLVHFLFDTAAAPLTADNFRIEGGERIRDIRIDAASFGVATNVVTFQVDRAGDFSPYTLRLVRSATDLQPPVQYDPILSRITFSFKAGCPTEFDCRDDTVCPPVAPPTVSPEIDYRARDYGALRRLALDRMSTTLPEWTERNPADIGIALVELLAYVGDQLSYKQDAVATEAYLHTARSRISVRRHARLVDYMMHDGCNARAWVQLQASTDLVPVSANTHLLSAVPGAAPRLAALPAGLDRPGAPVVFQTLHDITIVQAHDTMRFYTWGGRNCCLSAGATRATLRGAFPALQRGTWLVLAEARGPRTGHPQDADPARRHVVRLTRAAIVTNDPIGGRFDTPPTGDPVTVTEIEWGAGDALPFTLWVSNTVDSVALRDLSVAHGNIVLADQGRPVTNERMGVVPDVVRRPGALTECCSALPDTDVPPRFRPRLAEQPLTRRVRFDPNVPPPARPLTSAADVMRVRARDALPDIALDVVGAAQPWAPVPDLLGSRDDDAVFVIETENDGTVRLRFGDDHHGRRPAAGTEFEARYRVGNGQAGNVGLGALRHIVTLDGRVTGAANLLPAFGGIEPETIEEVRQRAPVSFRVQERAVTPEDYAAFAQQHPDVQRAAATFRWTGSWRTIFLTIDRRGGLPIDAAFESSVRQHLERHRLAGHDLEIDAPQAVSLEIVLDVCARPDHAAADVKRALLAALGAGEQPNRGRGFFHPDRLTFGQTVFLSQLYAAAASVRGVDTVSITKFERQNQPLTSGLASGRLDFDRLEIARCDNDPDFPERGILTINVGGGR